MNFSEIKIVVFETELRKNFYPLTLTRPSFDLRLGMSTLLDRLQRRLAAKVTNAVVPKYLEKIVRESHQSIAVNEGVYEPCIAINSLVHPRLDLRKEINEKSEERHNMVICDVDGVPVFASLDQMSADFFSKINSEPGWNLDRKELDVERSEEALLRYPWQLVSENGPAIHSDYEQSKRLQTGRSHNSHSSNYELLGNRLSLPESCEVERFVTFDTRNGPIIVGDGVTVQSFSHFAGPCYVGDGSIIKSARLREGTSVGTNCRVSGEIEESIISNYSNKNHDGFIGHSYIGSWVNLGAMTTNSDLKNTYGKIRVKINGSEIDSGLSKVGCFIGDMCKTAIGTLIFSGKKIGVSSHLFGTVTDDVPSFTLYGKSFSVANREMYLDSAITTQRRMMERRNLKMTPTLAELMESIFEMTADDRSNGDVREGKFALS